MYSQRALLSMDGEAQQVPTKTKLDTEMLACPTESIKKNGLGCLNSNPLSSNVSAVW